MPYPAASARAHSRLLFARQVICTSNKPVRYLYSEHSKGLSELKSGYADGGEEGTISRDTVLRFAEVRVAAWRCDGSGSRLLLNGWRVPCPWLPWRMQDYRVCPDLCSKPDIETLYRGVQRSDACVHYAPLDRPPPRLPMPALPRAALPC